MTLKTFINQRKHLVWYVKDHTALDKPAIVEATLNYGDWEDFQKLIEILGIEETAKVFREKSNLKRSNYRPEIKHYFKLYFNKYA